MQEDEAKDKSCESGAQCGTAGPLYPGFAGASLYGTQMQTALSLSQRVTSERQRTYREGHDALARLRNLQELEDLATKHPEVVRIIQLLRETGL